MYRFVALLHGSMLSMSHAGGHLDTLIQNVTNGRRNWQVILDRPGVAIVESGRSRSMAARSAGDLTVLGEFHLLRDRNKSGFTTGIDGTPEFLGCRSGDDLFAYGWGRYVAFEIDDRAGAVRIWRDPSGMLPCFHVKLSDLHIIFSDLADVAHFVGRCLTINWNHLQACLLLPRFQKIESALTGLSELMPGERWSITPDGIFSSLLWDPRRIASDVSTTDLNEASRLMHEAVSMTTATLASTRRSLIHSLGGLDSSIVLGCLATSRTAEQDIVGVNLRTSSPASDERRYARDMAKLAGVALIEEDLRADRIDLRAIFDGPPAAAPLGTFDCTARAGGLYDVYATHHADAHFTGVGGDNVFFQLQWIASALDHTGTRGVSRDSIRIAWEAARYAGVSFWFTAGEMARELYRPISTQSFACHMLGTSDRWPFIRRDIIEQGPRFDLLHPYLRPDDSLPKGKYFHLLTTALLSVEMYDFLEPDRSIERLHPLLSQPVVECLLRLPTWTLTYSGIDRGLARLAFHSKLPESVSRRRSKSSPEHLYNEIVDRDRAFITDVLLNGKIAAHGLFNRSTLEKVLRASHESRSVAHSLLEMMGWEAWISRTNHLLR